MMERLLDIKITQNGMIIEEIEIVCTMTGFRLHMLVEHLTDGSYCAFELGPG